MSSRFRQRLLQSPGSTAPRRKSTRRSCKNWRHGSARIGPPTDDDYADGASVTSKPETEPPKFGSAATDEALPCSGGRANMYPLSKRMTNPKQLMTRLVLLHPAQRRFLAEELVRLRRSDEQRRY